MNKNKHGKAGFTLLELIVVIAILAIIAVLAVPAFSNLKESSVRRVDATNARTLESVLNTAAASGVIKFPADSNLANGIFVLVCRDGSSAPSSYGGVITDAKTTYCGADTGIQIGEEVSKGFRQEFKALNQYLTENMGNAFTSLKSSASTEKIDGNGGWDWYIVEYVWNKSEQRFNSRIYSGMKGTDSDYKTVKIGSSNIEKYMGR